MHILYLHQHFCPPNGIGNNRSLELARHWVQCGQKVTIVAGSGNFDTPLPFYQILKKYEFDGIEVLRLNVGYSHYDSFTSRVWHFLCFLLLGILTSFKTTKIDLVYASSTPLTVGILGIWHKRMFGRNFVFETVDLWPDVPVQMGLVKNKWFIKCCYAIEKWIYNEAKHIVCLSEGMKQYILQKNVQESKVSVSHNGSNCSLFRPSESKISAKISLGYSKDDFIVLYAGTVGVANGLEEMIDLADKVSSPKIKFLILGDGNRKKEVVQYSISKQTKNLAFLNAVPKKNMQPYFDAADVGLVMFAPFLILETNSANKWFDYLASGLPVILNYEGWQNDYLRRYECGFGSRNLDLLAQWLCLVSKDTSLQKKMGENARELALSTFDRKKMADNLLEVFENIVH